MEFKYPQNIFYVIPAAAAVMFFILSFRKKERITALLRINYRIRLKALRTAFLFAGLMLTVFSLLGPQIFTGYAEARKTALDIYILIDTSKSMLTADIAPDRITAAKKIIESLLDNAEGDRIGFIPFASGAYVQMPLTDDYQLARMFLDVMDTDMISGGGTDLAAAVKLAKESFDRASGASGVIIILSDGEEHDGASKDILGDAADGKVKIYTIGIGTEKGGLIPVYGGTDNGIVDYMKDDSGNPVTSRLNADILKNLANAGNGAYYQISPQNMDVSPLLEELSYLERDEKTAEKMRQYKQLYQYFLGAGILMFVTAWFLPERGARGAR